MPPIISTFHQSSYENNVARLYWDKEILNDKTASHNRPDVTLFENTNKNVYLIDVNIPNSGNLQTVRIEKIRKFAALSIEVQRQWQG